MTAGSQSSAPLQQDDLGLLYSAVESLPSGVLIYHDSRELAYVNRRGREILGLPEATPVGMDVQDLLGIVPHEPGQPHRRHLEGVRNDFMLLGPHKEARHIGYETRRIRNADSVRPGAYVTIFQDVTYLQNRREERERDLMLESVSKLLPTIAHEIKNPLAAIQSVVEVLLGEPLGARHQRDLEAILNEVSRLRLLVDRMGLADQRLIRDGGSVDLAPTVERALHLARTRAAHEGIELRYAGEPEVRAPIHPDLLLTVLHNLLNNSLEACRAGDEIDVSVQCSQTTFSLAVLDTGEGMPPETLRRATELFYTTRDRGSGIGLALTRELLERSGGTLTISSRQGEGTWVSMTIPTVEQ